MLNKVKYGIIITVVLQILRLIAPDVEVPADMETMINGIINSVLVIIPWVMSYFVKETKVTTAGLTLAKP